MSEGHTLMEGSKGEYLIIDEQMKGRMDAGE